MLRMCHVPNVIILVTQRNRYCRHLIVKEIELKDVE